ncbi:MAG: type IV pilus modification PilV family protein [Bdellovibrio sp.]
MRNTNNKGFTAIEVVIGIGLVVIVTFALMSTQLIVTKESLDLTNQLEDSIDSKLAERIIFKDLNGVDPSYNNINVLDDAGKPFFDYFPDVPSQFLDKPIERSIAVNLSGRKEFYILTQDLNLGSMLNYDPVAAYQVGPTPDDFNASASLTFLGINNKNWVQAQRPNFWKDGSLLMLDTPVHIRPVGSDGKIDMKIAPRSPIFIGIVSSQNLTANSVINSLVNIKHPETNINITTADNFLRNAPAVGGGQTSIRMRAVRLIKYSLVAYKDDRYVSTPARLIKQSFENGKWSDPFLMADKVSDLEFKRDSTLKKMIYFKVNKVAKKTVK